MNQISIPPLSIRPKPSGNRDICGHEEFQREFQIRTLSFSTTLDMFKRSHRQYQLAYDKPITILGNSAQTIDLPILFLTSLPAVCVVTCDPILHRYNLSHNINIVPTNDTWPRVTLFNHTTKTITVTPFHLTVCCQIVLSGKNQRTNVR